MRSAEIILEQLNNNSIKAYLLFLKYVLNFLNNFNALFQSRKILIHKLCENSQHIIRQIAQNFVISEALKNIDTLDVNNEHVINTLMIYMWDPNVRTFWQLNL